MTYADTYSRFPLPKLLDVLDRPGEYHPEAVEAAHRELSRRGVAEDYVDSELESSAFSQ
jgi:hypothetical protein